MSSTGHALISISGRIISGRVVEINVFPTGYLTIILLPLAASMYTPGSDGVSVF